MLTACPNFDNFNFDIFDAVVPQCHFITSVLRAGRFPYVHWHLGVKHFTFVISTLVPLALKVTMKSQLWSGYSTGAKQSLPLRLGFKRFQHISLN